MRKHLVCHLWPAKHTGGTWRRTVDHLKARDELFDGERVIAVACDHGSDSFEEVQEAFSGYRCELAKFENMARLREVKTFRYLMEKAEQFPDDATFFCHGKGSTHQFDSVCQHWADMMWHVLCDYPRLRECILEQFPICGAFRRYDGLGCDWHYSGTFFWFRNRDVFTRDWRTVPRSPWGTEMWPSKIFGRGEACCIFMNNCGDLYDAQYWERAVTTAFGYWQEALHSAGASWTSCSTTRWHALPQTRFPPLQPIHGFGTTHPANGSSPSIATFLRRALGF